MIAITWTAAAIATGTPYYLVVNYSEPNTDGTANCDPNNVKVYRIVPQNAFWLDINPTTDGTIAGIPSFDMADAANTFDLCAPDVSSAMITDDGTTASVEYLYGQSVIYAIIHTAGYEGEWDASLQISNIMSDQDVVSVNWEDLGGSTSGTFTAPASLTFSATGTDGTVAGVWTDALPSTSDGTDILVTITIDNNHHEGLADQIINIAVDGSYTSGTETFNDKSDATADCSDEAAYADYVNETIKARPGVNAVPATGTFVADPTTLP